MDSEELFDYISDLPNDNVLEICNFVLIGGETSEDNHAATVDVITDNVNRNDTDQDSTSHSHDNHYNHLTSFTNSGYVEIMEYHGAENNNNNCQSPQEKVGSLLICFQHCRILNNKSSIKIIFQIDFEEDTIQNGSPTLHTSVQTTVVKAKRGRPPSKPPSKEVLKSRRRVFSFAFH